MRPEFIINNIIYTSSICELYIYISSTWRTRKTMFRSILFDIAINWMCMKINNVKC
jgi:hypothetical protein